MQLIILLFAVAAVAATAGIWECDVGSYKVCFFSYLSDINPRSPGKAYELVAGVPADKIEAGGMTMPEYISYWVKSPSLTPLPYVDDRDVGLTILIESPEHMTHSLQHAAGVFSLMNSGKALMPFDTSKIRRVINIHPEADSWAISAWARFWWSFVDVSVSTKRERHVNVSNVAILQGGGPPLQPGAFFFTKADAFAYRNKIYTKAGVPLKRTNGKKTVCIVSRTETRRIFNLDELVTALTNAGITPVVIRDPGRTYKNNPLDLVRLVSQCDVYISVLGSEAVFQIFMREKTSAFELMVAKRLDFWHSELAYTMGINWLPIYPLHETANENYLTWYGCWDSTEGICSYRAFSKFDGITLEVPSLMRRIMEQLKREIPHEN
jgi:hypothetical protein